MTTEMLGDRRLGLTRIAFIGRVAAGKDYLAERLVRLGYKRLSFSDPIHAFVRQRILQRDYAKGEPGIREILQTVGGAARGSIATPNWLHKIVENLGLSNWGNADFWVTQLEASLDALDSLQRVVVSDCRHENEVEFVESRGLTLFGVLCSETTRQERLKNRGEKMKESVEAHVSEMLSKNIEALIPPHRIVWNDDHICPCAHYIRYKEFLDLFARDMAS